MFSKKKLPEVKYTIKDLSDYQKNIQLEWLETNGLGGWAGASIIGTSTRRYHGLLVAANNLESRSVLVANQIESLHVGDSVYQLSTINFADTIDPHGFLYLKEFRKDPFSQFIFEISNQKHRIILSKTVLMVRNQNTTLIKYEILDSNTEDLISIRIEPLFAVRSYHALQKNDAQISSNYQLQGNTLSVRPKENFPEIFTKPSSGTFNYQPRWMNNLRYFQEDNRGYDFLEDLYSYGSWNIDFHHGMSAIFYSDTLKNLDRSPNEIIKEEKERVETILRTSKVTESIGAKLVIAADQFIIHANSTSVTKQQTILAGYPWFTDWGRDTFIALPGLCLATGRLQEAKLIMDFFGSKIKDGVVPNRILENQAVEYNAVDASLWFINSIYKYYKASSDKKWIKEFGLPYIRQILLAFSAGTINDIRLDTSDGLLWSGNEKTQLTWMDAKVGEWVVTPRHGKAVEINALWYNALKISQILERKFGDKQFAIESEQKSELLLANFGSTFWFEEGQYLFDVVRGDFKDAALRPNQVIAISLEFSPLSPLQEQKILQIVKKKLLTPFGLRTLSPDDLNYRGTYFGDAISRDASYHQGTVWAWLIGPFCRAMLKTYGAESHQEIANIIEGVCANLEAGVIGSISEIFDGDFPHKPRGCPAQAWSVAEVFDVWKTISQS